jgi:hypothetical protein
MYEYQSVLFIFDFINGKLPTSFNTVFTFNKDIPNARSTRQSHLLHITQYKSLFAHKLPLYELPKCGINGKNSSIKVALAQCVKNNLKLKYLI